MAICYLTDMSGTVSLFQSSGGASPDIYMDQIYMDGLYGFIYIFTLDVYRVTLGVSCGSHYMAVVAFTCLNTSAYHLSSEIIHDIAVQPAAIHLSRSYAQRRLRAQNASRRTSSQLVICD